MRDAWETIWEIEPTATSGGLLMDLWYLEIHSENATKQNATKFRRDTYGFERIVGFGDNLNDLPMFAACDVKIAVENAHPQVRNAADIVCDTNINDGVVKWLEEDLRDQ